MSRYQKAHRVTAAGFDTAVLSYSDDQLRRRSETVRRATPMSNKRKDADRRACRDFRHER